MVRARAPPRRHGAAVHATLITSLMASKMIRINFGDDVSSVRL
jgi:hypothetical protein